MFITLMIGASVISAEVSRYKKIYDKSEPFRSVIETESEDKNIPVALLTALLFKESSFDPSAVGSAGEVGLGQFKPIAAKDVDVNFDILKRSPDVQIAAAAELLDLNRKRLGNLFDSVRAYNAGVGAAGKSRGAGLSYALDVYRGAIAGTLMEGLDFND